MSTKLASAHAMPWALYGATGLTGRMILERALSRGHRPTLIGRDPKRLNQLAEPDGLGTIRANLGDSEALAGALAGHRLVLNAAGPFKLTAAPIAEAALNAFVDYIDVNGELLVLLQLLDMGERAVDRGVALIGGAGFGVAAADGLISQVVEKLGGVDSLRISVAADSAFKSKAVAESTLGVLAGGGYEIEAGRLVRQPIGRQRWRQRGEDGSDIAFASAPLAELAAALRIAHAAQVVAGVPMPHAQALVLSLIGPLLTRLLKLSAMRRLMENIGGHSAGAAKSIHKSRVWVDARAGNRQASVQLVAGEGFAAAADIAIHAVESALTKRPEPGAHTPATAFGSEFINDVRGIQVIFKGTEKENDNARKQGSVVSP